MRSINLLLPEEMLAMIDEVRGSVPRIRWIRDVIMAELGALRLLPPHPNFAGLSPRDTWPEGWREQPLIVQGVTHVTPDGHTIMIVDDPVPAERVEFPVLPPSGDPLPSGYVPEVLRSSQTGGSSAVPDPPTFSPDADPTLIVETRIPGADGPSVPPSLPVKRTRKSVRKDPPGPGLYTRNTPPPAPKMGEGIGPEKHPYQSDGYSCAVCGKGKMHLNHRTF